MDNATKLYLAIVKHNTALTDALGLLFTYDELKTVYLQVGKFYEKHGLAGIREEEAEKLLRDAAERDLRDLEKCMEEYRKGE